MSTQNRLAAFALASSLLSGCATMEGAKQDVGKIFGQNDNPTPTQPAAAQQSQEPGFFDKLKSGVSGAFSKEPVSAESKGIMNQKFKTALIGEAESRGKPFIKDPETECAGALKGEKPTALSNAYGVNSIENQVRGAIGGVARGKARGSVIAPIVESTDKSVGQSLQDKQMFCARVADVHTQFTRGANVQLQINPLLTLAERTGFTEGRSNTERLQQQGTDQVQREVVKKATQGHTSPWQKLINGIR